MNKTVKYALFAAITVIVILILIAAGFGLKFKSEVKKMHVVETGKVTSNIFAIKDEFVNMFLIKDGEYYVAIDAGADAKTISQELEKLNIAQNKVIAIFLTHSDGDHTAGLSVLKNASIFLAKEEEQMINGKTAKMMFFHNKLPRKGAIFIKDGQKITIGKNQITCILTPGHTPGSMSYLINGKYLFVGDAFNLTDGKVSKANSFFSKDIKMAVKSFDKINNLPGTEYIFTAHNGFTDNYKDAVNTELK